MKGRFDRRSIAFFERIGNPRMEPDNRLAGAGRESDHVHQGLHRLNRARQLVAQHRVARPVDQCPVKGASRW